VGALSDAGLADGRDIGMAWFGNCGMHSFGRGSIRGQVCLTPLARDGLLPERLPVVNVENACATSSSALHSAWKDVLSGQTDLALVVGVEQLFAPELGPRLLEGFAQGIDTFDTAEWRSYFTAAARAIGREFVTGPDRSLFMDTYALQAAHHMERW